MKKKTTVGNKIQAAVRDEIGMLGIIM